MKPLFLTLLLAHSALAATPDDTPVPLKFSVTSADPKQTLVSGEFAFAVGRPFSLERQAARGPERLALNLDLQALDDGRYAVRAAWKDVSSDGEMVGWEPTFVIKRGAETVVRLDFPGGARVLRVSAQ